MKNKDIIVGNHYILASNKKSTMGCARKYFKDLQNCEVQVIKKLNNFHNKNTIFINGIFQNGNNFDLVGFWCSPYDLKEIT